MTAYYATIAFLLSLIVWADARRELFASEKHEIIKFKFYEYRYPEGFIPGNGNVEGVIAGNSFVSKADVVGSPDPDSSPIGMMVQSCDIYEGGMPEIDHGRESVFCSYVLTLDDGALTGFINVFDRVGNVNEVTTFTINGGTGKYAGASGIAKAIVLVDAPDQFPGVGVAFEYEFSALVPVVEW